MTAVPIYTSSVELLPLKVYASNEDMGDAAATEAAAIIRGAIMERGVSRIILATGNSQLTFLQNLREADGIDWSKVIIFHMDEYVGLDSGHSASFPVFLHLHFLDYVDVGIFHPVKAKAGQLEQNCSEYAELLRAQPIDLCAMGIGENGHIAFNDPPFAEFEDPVWVKVVRLDEVSRKQQVGEGHFPGLADVPTHAITLTIPALLSARRVLCIVPESRKANAVQTALQGPITDTCPASILRHSPQAQLYLDIDAAAQIIPAS